MNIKYYSILVALSKLPFEGVASILDNDRNFDKKYVARIKEERPLKYQEILEFRELTDVAPLNLAKIDSILARCSRAEITMDKAQNQIFTNMPWGGHTVGFYMAKAIKNNLGRHVLIKKQYSTIGFILAYQKATSMDKTLYTFSKESIEFLKRIK